MLHEKFSHPSIAQLVERWTVVCSMSDIHRSLVQIRLEGVSKFFRSFSHLFLDSLVVRISACHVEGPGSIPGRGGFFFHMFNNLPTGDQFIQIGKEAEVARVAQSVER